MIFHMTLEEIQSKIEEYLPVRKEEKDKFGEVFTPIDLINEMMENLSPIVWQNPSLIWLDPASGIGNFPMVVYNRLMDSLPDTYNKDDIKYSTRCDKSNHILTKMIFMCEINAKNVKIAKDIFGQDANICCCDFLEEDKWKSQFGKTSFDIIIGNPPFSTCRENKLGTTAGRGILWDKFIVKSLEIINEGGYLGFITPPSWRKPENKLLVEMVRNNQMMYLHMFDKNQGKALFNIGVKVDLYIIKRNSHHTTTEIIDTQGITHHIDLSSMRFIPNFAFDIISKIITDNGIQVIYSTEYHGSKRVDIENPKPNAIHRRQKQGVYKYPVIHSLTRKGLEEGLLFTNDNTLAHFGVSKVVLNLNPNQYPVNDFQGKYGMSELSFGIPITSKKQGDDIIKAINTDGFRQFIKATVWNTFAIQYQTFRYIKPDFYKYFL